MKYLTHVLCLCLIASCQKNDTDSTNRSSATPIIIRCNPSQVETGDQITISGKNFGIDKSKVVIKLDSISLSATLVSDTQIIVTIPANFIPLGEKIVALKVLVNGIESNSLNIKIYTAFHGWRYISPSGLSGFAKSIAFSDDYRGMITGPGFVVATSDGGISWGGVFSGYNTIGTGISVYSEDHLWLEYNGADIVYRNQHDPIFYWFTRARFDTITTIEGLGRKAITGLYTFNPFRGYILNEDGAVFKINGSFSPQDISFEYKSQFSTGGSDIQFYKLSALDSNNMVFVGWPGVYPNRKLVLVHKKAGTYTEFDLTSQLYNYKISNVQITDPSTIYILDGYYKLYRFTAGGQLTILKDGISAFCFIDSNVGYACGNEKVYKTVDGGNSWFTVFVLSPSSGVYAMATLNGKVWGAGEYTGAGGFVIRYDP